MIIVNGITKRDHLKFHKRLYRKHGRATKCEAPDCASTSPKRFEWALKKGHAYSGNPDDYMQLCPSCHRKYDYTPEHRHNMSLAKRGETSRSKLTEKDVYAIRELIIHGKSNKDIAVKYKVASTTISNIKTWKRWTHLPLNLTDQKEAETLEMPELIKKHLGWHPTSLEMASVKYFAESGNVSGNLYRAIENIASEWANDYIRLSSDPFIQKHLQRINELQAQYRQSELSRLNKELSTLTAENERLKGVIDTWLIISDDGKEARIKELEQESKKLLLINKTIKMSVRAKFKVNSVTKTDHWEKDKGQLASISLSAVYGDSEENKKFFASTPNGQITLGTVNPAAFEQFEQGKEYYVTFEKAE